MFDAKLPSQRIIAAYHRVANSRPCNCFLCQMYYTSNGVYSKNHLVFISGHYCQLIKSLVNQELTNSLNPDLSVYKTSETPCCDNTRSRRWVSEWVCLNWHKRKWKLLWLLPPYPNHKYPLECPIIVCPFVKYVCVHLYLLIAICLETYGIHTDMGRLNKHVFSMFSLDELICP